MPGRATIFAVAAMVVVVGAGLLIGFTTTGGPDPVASLKDLREREVLFLGEHNIFVVYNDGTPLALSDDPQHLEGEHTEWCESSQLFETPTHGEKFDRRGYYYAGPASKGLDRYQVRVEGDGVYIDPNQIIPGPERGEGRRVNRKVPSAWTRTRRSLELRYTVVAGGWPRSFSTG